MKKIIIAPDSFKGSLSSNKVADAIEEGVLTVFPQCETIKIPVSDGGEGIIETLIGVYNAELVKCETVDSLFRPIRGYYAVSGVTAIFELACVNGLPLLKESERNPLLTSTYGTGLLIQQSIKQGYNHIILGIGGSATNDAATGMLQALGFRFLDKGGKELGYGGEILNHIYQIDDSGVIPELKKTKFTVLTDVNNPFYGEEGASYVFAKQKGAAEKMIKRLDYGLKNFAKVIEEFSGINVQNITGAGAAGGVGGTLKALLNTELLSGIDFLLDKIEFDKIITDADLIITGEGKIDSQSNKGKAPFGILKRGMKNDIPVIAISGNIEEYEENQKEDFNAVFSILPAPASISYAMNFRYSLKNITRTVTQIMKLIKIFQ